MVKEVEKKVTRLLLAEADDTDMIIKNKDIKGFIPNLAVGQMFWSEWGKCKIISINIVLYEDDGTTCDIRQVITMVKLNK